MAVEADRLTRADGALGTQIELLVLAVGGGALAAVDMSTGGLVRASLPADTQLAPYDVASACVGDGLVWDPAQPEAIDLTGPIAVQSRLRGRKAERCVRPLLHPVDEPILGLVSVAAPYWTLCGDRPSLAVVDPGSPLEIIRHGRRLHCFFHWRGNVLDLPIVDRRVSISMAQRGQQNLRIRRRFVVALTPPHKGNCYKVIAGLLPRG
ncbi:MAG: hypothetical protein H0W70_11320 [Actinobacteria bacterium]|nr:hypothetical protein [Actinomycetota bacterium]